MNLKQALLNLLFIALSTIVAAVLLKGFYEIYISKTKTSLKEKPLIKYGMPLVFIVILLAYLFQALGL